MARKGRAPAAMPSEGQVKPERGISVSSRRGWGPGASGKKKLPVRRQVLSHVGPSGQIRMVDVGAKPITEREAVARGSIAMSRQARRLIQAGNIKKGDPLQAARVAGILAAKQTAALIPLCHPLPLSTVQVDLTPSSRGYEIEARVRTSAQTGVEMEALTAVSVAALTIYDMVKAVDKAMVIGEIRLMFKSGGKSGTYRRARSPI
jgi:cyclic pyranopterin monophosphate synthase